MSDISQATIDGHKKNFPTKEEFLAFMDRVKAQFILNKNMGAWERIQPELEATLASFDAPPAPVPTPADAAATPQAAPKPAKTPKAPKPAKEEPAPAPQAS